MSYHKPEEEVLKLCPYRTPTSTISKLNCMAHDGMVWGQQRVYTTPNVFTKEPTIKGYCGLAGNQIKGVVMEYHPTIVSRGHYGATKLPDHILSHIRQLIDDSIFKNTPLVYTVYNPYSHGEGCLPFIIITPNHANRFRARNRVLNYADSFERLWIKISDFVHSLRLDRSHLNLKWFSEEDVEFIAHKSYELFEPVRSSEEGQELMAFVDLGQNERELVVRTVKTILESPEAPRSYLPGA